MKVPEIRTILLTFLFVNITLVIFLKQGPSGDEGIYILSGLELLNGLPDTYSSWHNGSPFIWSLFAGWVYSFTSLIGLRIVTVLMGTTILYLIYLYSKKFLNEKDARLSVLMIALFAPFWTFSQIAVYDVPGLLLFTLAVVLVQKKKIGFIVLAALFSGLAVLAKYAFIVFFPFLMLFLVLVYERKSLLPLIVLCGVSGSIVMAHNFLVFNSIIPVSYDSYTVNSVRLGFNSLYSLGISVFILLPFILSYLSVRTKIDLPKRWFLLFFGGLLLWPLFHIVTGNPVSAQKHILFGLVFSAPLLVFNFKASLAKAKKGTFFAAGFFFFFQYVVIFNSWSDLWKANEVLSNNISEESTIISNVGTYRTRYTLYEKMPGVSSQIRNYHALTESEKQANTPADFLLWKEVPDTEMQDWLQNRQSSYKKIESYTDFFIGAEDHLSWGFHTIEISVYQKIN
ncbi:MAG: glycosyltransferase family 39 protein [Balneolaceae bacterium]|nr:glycosyltransferase family 39 protein [Balneolaceae bacterium]MBO6547575.1 glycosyltransferase family 39 protein [Balneolaceae bacterium]MBO6648086.1 glycosyltransferase family 39 protein [Balneolaceae bacterium]